MDCTAPIEDARLFTARLEIADSCDQRPATLEDLAPLLALFARSRARQEALPNNFLPDIIGQGLVRLSHPDLLIDFLVPEKGRGSDKPFPLKALGINAQPIRFLNLLLEKKVTVRVGGIAVTMPHPLNLGLDAHAF